MSDAAPSSASTGFFQSKPQVISQLDEDETFRRAVSFFLPAQIQQQTQWIVNAEENPPSFRHQDTFGRPQIKLTTSEGWRNLQALGIKQGTVATGYQGRFGPYDRIFQFLKVVVWTPSSALVGCLSAMQDGAAVSLKKYVQDGNSLGSKQKLFRGVLDRLTSRDPEVAWTSGQWRTERAGGSDVRGTETRARRPKTIEDWELQSLKSVDGGSLGDWCIDGFKWFSSATDADMAVLLAKTPGSDNLSVLYGPLKRQRLVDGKLITEFNGGFPQRLKNKLGTKALPTAELELKGMRAHMLEEEGLGVKHSAVLTLTQIHTAVASIGYLGRGFGYLSSLRSGKEGRWRDCLWMFQFT